VIAQGQASRELNANSTLMIAIPTLAKTEELAKTKSTLLYAIAQGLDLRDHNARIMLMTALQTHA